MIEVLRFYKFFDLFYVLLWFRFYDIWGGYIFFFFGVFEILGRVYMLEGGGIRVILFFIFFKVIFFVCLCFGNFE